MEREARGGFRRAGIVGSRSAKLVVVGGMHVKKVGESGIEC